MSFGANILCIQSVPIYSHQLTHYKLIEALALNGHNLTVFTTHFKNFNNPNITQYVFKELQKSKMLESELDEMNKFEFYFKQEMEYHYNVVKDQFEHPKLQELLLHSQYNKIDLVIIECEFCMFYKLAEIYNCPIVGFYSAEPLKLVFL